MGGAVKPESQVGHIGGAAARPGTLQPLAPVLAQTLRQAGLGRVVLMAQIARHWEEIVGPQLATVACPEGVRSRVLFVTVVDALWLQQLTFYQGQMLQNICRVLGDVPIDKLHFVLATAAGAATRQTETAPPPPPLSPAEERHILESTADLADIELRRVVRRVWRRGAQSGRYGT